MQRITLTSQGFIAKRTGKESSVMKYLLTLLLSVALCGTVGTALAAKKAVDGAGENPAQKFAQDASGLSKEELKGRRDQLRAYFAKRRARLQIVDTTVTDSGQVIDWIRPESQVPGGHLASPPAEAFGDSEAKAEPKGLPVPFELEIQPHARGPKGTVPVMMFTSSLTRYASLGS